jgi:hypothetical protein
MATRPLFYPQCYYGKRKAVMLSEKAIEKEKVLKKIESLLCPLQINHIEVLGVKLNSGLQG